MREDAEVLLDVVIGSRLHGLSRPDSDYDIKGVKKSPPIDIISPFRNTNTESMRLGEGGEEDKTYYELIHFVKLATKGNPTILEVLWSNLIRQSSKIGDMMRYNKVLFLDSNNVHNAHRGYAANQFKKMNIWDATKPEQDNRTPKFCVAYMRSLVQGIELLRTGDFSPQVKRDKDLLLEVKNSTHAAMLANENGIRDRVWAKFAELQVELSQAFAAYPNQFKPDIGFIEELIEHAYLNRKFIEGVVAGVVETLERERPQRTDHTPASPAVDA